MNQLQPIVDRIWIAEGSDVSFHGFPVDGQPMLKLASTPISPAARAMILMAA